MLQVAPVPAAVVADLRRTRRRHRVAEIHWIDALYQVYLAGLGVVAVVAVLSTVIGDEQLDPAAVRTLRADGPAVLGLAVALAVFVGVRSGGRGGPVAVEAADVRHVLLAPVDRGTALRGPARRQLRFAAFGALGVGAACGQFAARRFPDDAAAWIACGALAGLTIVGLALGTALVASGRRLPSWAATVVGGALVLWAVADIAFDQAPPAPTSTVGRIPLWPLGFDGVGLAAVGLAAVLVGIGLLGIAGVSLEAAERRTALVGQLRFAVTLQDLRTALVLRRQLAAELPRARPWIGRSRRHGPARFPVWQRGWRGVLRWPLPRIVRLVALALVAGFALDGVASGTTPLLAVAGVALWVAALDAIEPLAQETDHPGRRDSYPIDEGHLMLRHLGVPLVVMAVIAGGATAVAAALVSSTSGGDVGVMVVALPSLVAAATSGAVVSVLMGAPKPFDEMAIASPEIAGMRTVMRTIWPLALACLGPVPVLLARHAATGDGQPLVAAGAATAGVLGVGALVAGWVRHRAEIRAWWVRHGAAAAQRGSDGVDEGEPR